MKTEVVCKDKFGNVVTVSAEQLKFRLSVCGILQSSEKELLFIKDRSTNMWELPGGEVEATETVSEALVREFKEETTIEVRVGSLVGFTEDYYYHRKDNQGYKSLRLCFLVYALSEPTKFPDSVKYEFPETNNDFQISALSLELIKQFSSSKV